MNYTNLGKFTPVKVVSPNPHKVIVYNNEDGVSFYEIVKKQSSAPSTAYFLAYEDGRIVSGATDLSTLSPHELTVIKVTDGLDLLAAYQANQDYELFYHIWDGTEIKLNAPPKAEWLAVVVARINDVHAGFLAKFTGNASTEERDTWPIKLALAKQVIAETASSTDIALMAVEAIGAGITTLELANVIVTKAENYSRLIWLAGSIRKKGIEQVKAASEYSEVAAIETGLLADVDTAVVEYLKAIGGAS